MLFTSGDVPVAHEFSGNALCGSGAPSPVNPEWPIAIMPTGCWWSGVAIGLSVGDDMKVCVACSVGVTETVEPEHAATRSDAAIRTAPRLPPDVSEWRREALTTCMEPTSGTAIQRG